MRLVSRFPAPAAITLAVGCLLTPFAWADSSPAAANAGSCEEATVRQSSAYLDRLKAKEYSAAGDIARAAADICLDMKDLKGAGRWFQAARALGRRSNSAAARDEQFGRRYKEALADVAPRRNDERAGETRMAAKHSLAEHANVPQRSDSTASNAPGADADMPNSEQGGGRSLAWIGAATGFGVLVLGAAVLIRPNYLAMIRGQQRAMNRRRLWRRRE